MYIVNFAKGTAVLPYFNKKGKLFNRTYAIFIDFNGIYISTREGKVYLHERNSNFV